MKYNVWFIWYLTATYLCESLEGRDYNDQKCYVPLIPKLSTLPFIHPMIPLLCLFITWKLIVLPYLPWFVTLIYYNFANNKFLCSKQLSRVWWGIVYCSVQYWLLLQSVIQNIQPVGIIIWLTPPQPFFIPDWTSSTKYCHNPVVTLPSDR